MLASSTVDTVQLFTVLSVEGGVPAARVVSGEVAKVLNEACLPGSEAPAPLLSLL